VCADLGSARDRFFVRKSDKINRTCGRETAPGFLLSSEIGRDSAHGPHQATRPPALRAPHGSGALLMAVHCFRIVFFNGPRSGAMHFCLVAARQKDRSLREAPAKCGNGDPGLRKRSIRATRPGLVIFPAINKLTSVECTLGQQRTRGHGSRRVGVAPAPRRTGEWSQQPLPPTSLLQAHPGRAIVGDQRDRRRAQSWSPRHSVPCYLHFGGTNSKFMSENSQRGCGAPAGAKAGWVSAPEMRFSTAMES
jgi:hypothetical protein